MKKAHSVSTPQPVAPDPDRADAEQAVRMLDRLAEMAMERAEAMHAAALAAIKAGDTAATKDLELSLDRIALGVRRTLALKLRLARERQEMAEKAAAGASARAEEKAQRRRQVARAVAGSIKADRETDTEKAETLSADMWERLIEDDDIDAVLALAGHPIEEIVIHLCRDMGIRPELVLDPGGAGTGRPQGLPPAGGPPDEAGPPGWPVDGPDAGRYWRFVEPGWYDLDTCEKLNRPPWELKLGGG